MRTCGLGSCYHKSWLVTERLEMGFGLIFQTQQPENVKFADAG